MKLFKHKHFMSLIYSVLVALPFFTIFGRVIYTQSNNNANQSYSDKYLSQQITINTTYDYIENQNYLISLNRNLESFTPQGFKGVFDYDFKQLTSVNMDNSLVDAIFFNENVLHTYRYDSNTNNFVYYVGINISSFDTLNIPFTFKNFNIASYNSFIPSSNYNLKTYILSIDTLDNAFEYSLSTFTQENNFGNLDFFSWFSNLFLDTSNTHNMLYINFVNWYMNYALFISLAYVLFLVLMWFVSFVRRLLENTQNMNIGGL